MNIKLSIYSSLFLFSITLALKCGPEYGKCPASQCCNKEGECGTTAAYCSTANGCQYEFGDCKCSGEFGSCSDNLCCSRYNYCGESDTHCTILKGCQIGFGKCKCGQKYGKCPAGQCCGKDGYCGTTKDYCSSTNGCQSDFGDCKCGGEFGVCGDNKCCSRSKYCGISDAHCSILKGCQIGFGKCKCGPGYGKCPAGQCCSKDGFCGTTKDYCSFTNGCQSEFGDCKCGSEFGVCGDDQCCSRSKYCGISDAHCSILKGCQIGFGKCKCGPGYGKCPAGQCCSKDGFCGTTKEYCSFTEGCQSEFGDCKCGSEFGVCGDDLCCSRSGYCGTSVAHCAISNNCQNEYGVCRCGPEYGNCPACQCCNDLGYCGKTDAYCAISNGNQWNYGICEEGNENENDESYILKYSPETMEESYDDIHNPYRGWFHGSFTIDLTERAYTDCNFIYAFSSVRKAKPGLQYLGVRLSEYYNKKISQEALTILDNLLNEYVKRKEEIDPTTQVILRFYYDSGTVSLTKNRLMKGSKTMSEEQMFIKNELDNGELYITKDDINYMEKFLNSDKNSDNINDTKDDNKKREESTTSNFSKRENGQFVLVEEYNCYRYVPTDLEPENLNTILGHIDQLTEIVNKYKDIIYIYQGIFVGRWGEMHSTEHATSLETSTTIMNTLNEQFDPSIFLAVRTPCQYRGITNEIKKLDEESYEALIKRLGLFNDGLFYSESDTGTYGSDVTCFNDDKEQLYVKKPREEEVEFQNNLCLTVPNGGEVLSNTNEDKYEEIYELSDIEEAIANPDNYNNLYVCEDHSKNIHISYFNDEYDRKLYERWNTTFSKQIYQPNWSHLSGEEYMGLHLGYRYVLRESTFMNNTLTLSLENIGFAPAYKPFQSLLILNSFSSNYTVTLNIDTDNRNWPINETITLTINIEDNLSQLTDDSYDVYFDLYDPNIDYDIRFANSNEYYEDLGYKIGEITKEKENNK